MEQLMANRFRVLAELGRGGMGTVYRVEDTLQDKRVVALKTIQMQGSSTPELKLRFQEEFRAMVKLKHPNTVEVYDYGMLDAQTRYLTMEVVSGKDLAQLLSEGPLPLDRVYGLLIQLLQALGFIHSRIYVHRDIKADNIRIMPNGTLKLMDFGLMEQLGIPSNGKLTGTPGYLPPEVPKGGVINASSDLYSVGCLAFEMLTGRLPFTGSVVEVIKAHINQEPPSLRSLRPDAPEALEALIGRLMQKDQARRYQEASEVIADLADLAGLRISRENLDQKRSYLMSSALVGRDRELAMLEEALGDCQAGKGRSVFVGAPAGVGKSRLVHELTLHAKLADVPVLHGQCLETGMEPYEPLAQALRQVVSVSTPEELSLFGPVLAKIMPELAKQGVTPAPALEPNLERARLIETLTAWLRSVTERTPLLLFMDDLHWSDAQSLEAFNHLIRQMTDAKLFCLATFRSDEAPPSSPIWYTLEEGLTRDLKLSTFNLQQVLSLLQAMLRQYRISSEFSQFLYESTAGNAFFITEVLRYLMEEGVLVQKEGSWVFPETVGNLVLPTSVEAAIVRRLSQLGEGSRKLARVASVLGRYQVLDQLLALSGLDEDELFANLDELIERQFIVREEHGYTFPHDRVREALYEDMPEDERRDLHQRYAEVIEKEHAADTSTVINELAYHFLRGRDGVKAFEYLRMVGFQASDAGHATIAIQSWKHAEELLETLDYPNKESHQVDLWWNIGRFCTQAWPKIGVEVLTKMIPTLEAQGDIDRTSRLFKTLVGLVKKLPTARRKAIITKLTQPKIYRHRIRKGLARHLPGSPAWTQRLLIAYGYLGACYGLSGQPMKGLDSLKRALSLLPFTDTHLEGGMLASTAVCLKPAGQFDEIQKLAARSALLLGEEHVINDPTMRTAWMGQLGARLTVSFQGIRPDFDHLETAIQKADEGNEFSFKNYFWGRTGIWTAWTGRHDETMDFIEKMNQNCRKIGAPPYQWALYLRPYLHWQRGEFEEALALVLQTLRYPHLEHDAFAALSLHTLRGQLHLELGELDAAEQDFADVERRGREHQLLLVTIRALIGRGQVALARGQLADAKSVFAEAYGMAEAGPARNPLHQAIAARFLAEVAFRDGELDESRDRLDEAMAILTRPEQDNLFEQGHVLRLRAKVLLAQGLQEEALETLREAGSRFRAISNRYLARAITREIDALQAPVETARIQVVGAAPQAPQWEAQLAGVTSEGEYLQEALAIALDLLEADEGSIYRLDPEPAWVTSRGADGPRAQIPLPPKLLERVLEQGTGQVHIDVPSGISLGTNFDLELTSSLLAPIIRNGERIAMIHAVRKDVANPLERASLDHIAPLMEAMAERLATRTASVEAAAFVTLAETLRRTMHQHSLSGGSQQSLLAALLKDCVDRLELDEAAVVLGEEPPRCVAAYPAGPEAAALNMDLVAQVLATRQSHCGIDMPNVTGGSNFAADLASVAILPLADRGTLYCVRRQLANPLGLQDLQPIEEASNVLAEALEVILS
ncbi:Serine/threonine-protein kinase StkP [compost metagenome]